MKIDLTCPVELWQFTMPTQDELECTFILNNVSDKVVISVQVTLVCHDQEQELLFRQIERIQGLSAGAGERFSIMLLPTQWRDVAGVELVIEKVWFDDATIWRRGSSTLMEYTSNVLPNGRRLDQLRFVAGKDALGYPQEQDHVWMCVCGRANSKNSNRCCRCGRRLETVFASYQRQNVDQLIAVHEQKLRDIAKRAREDAGRLAEEREKTHSQKQTRRKNIIKIGLSSICVVAVVAVMVIWGVPTLRYNQADALLAAGKFDEARAAFQEMENYRDAAEQLIRCDYWEARSWLEAEDTQSLQRAADTFARLEDYEDSRALWQQATYQLGEQALSSGAYESAAENFQMLGDYQDSAEKLNETTYQQAEFLFENQSYTAAEVLFTGLKGYKLAAEKTKACEYAMGQAAAEADDYETAILHYSAIEDYEDAANLLKAACYALGDEKLAENLYEEAGNLYLRADDYQDAKLKANNSLYQLAHEMMTAADYEKAASLFERISTYLDSESQAWECVYKQAEAAQQDGQIATANLLYSSIPQHRDATERATECQYLIAMEALAHGGLAEAASILEELSGYKDSYKQLNQIRYQMAEQAVGEGNYQRATELFESLEGYLDSSTRLKQCKYQMAQNALADQDYVAAMEGFASLAGYEDAGAKLETATYELAMRYKESGDLEKAISLLSTLPGSSDAKAQLADIALSEALQKKEAGDLEGASELFLAMGDTAGARDHYLACQYELAAQKKEAGLLSEAGTLYLALGDYLDAAAQGEACYQQYYGSVADPAREAFTAQNYAVVIETLDGFAMADLPTQYRDLPDLYQQACYAYAEQLYNQGKPYEALPYYERIPDYKDVKDKKLERRCYLILGTWESTSGKQAVFRADGTCNLMGVELAFSVDNYSLFTGETSETLQMTHKLTSITKEGMTLRDTTEGRNIVYKFNRVEEEAQGSTLSPSTTAKPNELDEMLVQEDEDATPKP